jgi:chemotaxis family two-component system sensor kinase Cph1
VDRAEQLERTNHDLEVSNVELASLVRSNLELDSFAHIASHDLKEPLRGIYNYAHFLIEDYGPVVGEDGREKLETLVRLSRRMEVLIDSLLALSSIGRADLAGAPTDLRALIDDVLESYLPRLEDCNGSVSFVTPLPTVCVDAVRVSQVFNNLFSNALKYREQAPRIEIGIDPDHTPPPTALKYSTALTTNGNFVTVFVRDNGIGIRAKHLTSIFQMFKRLHAADSYGGGTGAGLAIASKIVERHAGHMWAESTFGSGTTFYFTLPTRC